MTAGLEAPSAEEFIFNTLTGDATLLALLAAGADSVQNTQAPEGSGYPLVLYQFMSGIDYAAVGAARIWTNMLYLVKVVADSADFSVMNAAVARIDTLLHRASGAVADGTVWSCTREQVIRLPDQVANRQFRQAGALYRLYAA